MTVVKEEANLRTETEAVTETSWSAQQAASSVLYTTSCKHSLVLPRMGEIIARNMLNWLKLLIKLKLLLLHLFILLYQWCTVTKH